MSKVTKPLSEANVAFLLSLGYTLDQLKNATNFMCDQARKPGVTDAKASVNAALEKANKRAEYQPREKKAPGVHKYVYPATKFGKPHPKAGQWNGSYEIVGPNGETVYGNPNDFKFLLTVLPGYINQLVEKPKA